MPTSYFSGQTNIGDISGLKLMKTITLKQILFKAKKILNKIQYPKERKKKKTKTPQTQPKKRESRERERVEKEERIHRHKERSTRI